MRGALGRRRIGGAAAVQGLCSQRQGGDLGPALVCLNPGSRPEQALLFCGAFRVVGLNNRSVASSLQASDVDAWLEPPQASQPPESMAHLAALAGRHDRDLPGLLPRPLAGRSDGGVEA